MHARVFLIHDAHERLHGRVVPRRGYRAHRRADFVLAHGLGQQQRHVLGPVDEMVKNALTLTTTPPRNKPASDLELFSFKNYS